jgi:hypothetical protein
MTIYRGGLERKVVRKDELEVEGSPFVGTIRLEKFGL